MSNTEDYKYENIISLVFYSYFEEAESDNAEKA